ncbi:MAG TPA: dephospho-CoA kinase [Candidatus Angelobacter sp.]|nr:dephospho-CoA kinase [Candidatus Angelobacter sp.]
MVRVGLTGGIACGKSTVAGIFAELGARVVDADAIVHGLYRPGEEVYQELIRRFGNDIVKPDGEIDRARLATAAFDGGRVAELNKIVHPAVFRKQEQWIRDTIAQDPDAVVVVEATLILEAGGRDRFDKIVVVTCKPEQKIQRLAGRAGLNEAAARVEVERRTRAQLPDEEKAHRADFVIDNSGSLEATRRQVHEVFAKLSALANG